MKLFAPLLKHAIRTGAVVVIDADGIRHTFGEGAHPVTMRLHDRRLHWGLALSPSLSLGEGFSDGTLTLEEGTTLYQLLTVLMSNLKTAAEQRELRLADAAVRAIGRWRAAHGRSGQRAHQAFHYELSDELFELFLDTDRQYSCAYFKTPSDSLDEAQTAKKEIIARKLLLSPGLRVLDIGSGWGGLALTLAVDHGADVTGLTVSKNQWQASAARAENAGVSSRCRFLLKDYREERGRYDRIVSVGMFEHVGLRQHDTFFKGIANRLSDNGVALVHAIGLFARPRPVPAFFERHIFPGTYVPTLSQVLPAVERAGLHVTDIEIWRLHYAETLRHWRLRFLAMREQALKLYDERFCRMWEYYLTCCEVAFRIGELMVWQLQLTKTLEAAPLTRDYMFEVREK